MIAGKGTNGVDAIPEDVLSDRLPDPPPGEPSLNRAIQSRIGDHLRAMYDDLMQQPVPDRFAELLSRLERSDEGRTA